MIIPDLFSVSLVLLFIFLYLCGLFFSASSLHCNNKSSYSFCYYINRKYSCVYEIVQVNFAWYSIRWCWKRRRDIMVVDLFSTYYVAYISRWYVCDFFVKKRTAFYFLGHFVLLLTTKIITNYLSGHTNWIYQRQLFFFIYLSFFFTDKMNMKKYSFTYHTFKSRLC